MTDESLILDIDILEKKHEEEIANIVAEKDKELLNAIADKDKKLNEKDRELDEQAREIAFLKKKLKEAGIPLN